MTFEENRVIIKMRIAQNLRFIKPSIYKRLRLDALIKFYHLRKSNKWEEEYTKHKKDFDELFPKYIDLTIDQLIYKINQEFDIKDEKKV